MAAPFEPPAYPYDRLDGVRSIAARFDGGAVDCSIGTPCDPPPVAVVEALAGSGAEHGYPPSIGSVDYRRAAAGWLDRELGVAVDPDNGVAACIGTKELVAGLPHLLRLRRPDRDTVLYPAVSYPSYAMGATLARCRAVPVAVDDEFNLDLESIDPDDAARALVLWVNSPGNPAGNVDDLDAAAQWGRSNDVLVASDECYVEFTWSGERATILAGGVDGVLAVHSLSKRSNLAGVRAGFYAGDHALVHYLREVRKHAGSMVPGPVQSAAVAAWADQEHVTVQRNVYRQRLSVLGDLCSTMGLRTSVPGGGFYLWVPAPDGDAWALTERFAAEAGIVVTPGEFFGPDASRHVRIAAVQPDERLDLARSRLG